jgi:hypothetical protein
MQCIRTTSSHSSIIALLVCVAQPNRAQGQDHSLLYPVDDYSRVSQEFRNPNSTHLCRSRDKNSCPRSVLGQPKEHVAHDIPGIAGVTRVYAVGQGIVAFAETRPTCSENWGHVIVVHHSLPILGEFSSVYGHLDPGSVTLRRGDRVDANTLLGVVGDYSNCWSDHLHFGIHVGPNQPLAPDSYPIWLAGYKCVECSPDGFVDPKAFVNATFEPSLQRGDCRIAPGEGPLGSVSSEFAAFRSGFLRWQARLSCPADNGGGAVVHDAYGIRLQDFFQRDPSRRFSGSDGWTALILSPNRRAANLIRSGFWGAYKCLQIDGHGFGGATLLGAPTNEEDLQPNGVTRQDFERGYMTWGPDPPRMGNAIRIHLNEHHIVPSDVLNTCVGAIVLDNPPPSPPPNVDPHVTVSPSSGAVGTPFQQNGSGFTPNGTATLSFRRPDRIILTATENIDGDGNYFHSYTSQSTDPAGQYAHWAVDNASGIISPSVYYIFEGCGDGTCDGSQETAVSCSADCSCAVSCMPCDRCKDRHCAPDRAPVWSCSPWSLCDCNGTQTRSCSDLNNCGTTSGRPPEGQACVPPICTGASCGAMVCNVLCTGQNGAVCPVNQVCDAMGRCDSQNCPECQTANGPSCVPILGSVACTSDTNPCTADFCQNGQCVHPPLANNVTCPDDDETCTTDFCVNGICEHVRVASDCGARVCGPSPSSCYSCGPITQSCANSCGNQGTQSCDVQQGIWGPCTGGSLGSCSPASSRGCPSGTGLGTQQCSATCEWGPCLCSCVDGDGDGHFSTSCTDQNCQLRDDCVDGNENVHPGVTEICGNGIDDDCAGGDEPCVCTPNLCQNSGVSSGTICDGDDAVTCQQVGGCFVEAARMSCSLGCRASACWQPLIETIAGSGGSCSGGPCGDGGPALNALFGGFGVRSIALDSLGAVYLADTSLHRIRRFTTGGIMQTIAGVGTPCDQVATPNCGNGGLAAAAYLSFPHGLLIDSVGTVFVADSTQQIRSLVVGGNISAIAGSGAACQPTSAICGDGGSALNAQFFEPYGFVRHANGAIDVACAGQNRIRRFSIGGTIATIAGNGTSGYSGDGGPAIGAQLEYPADVALDASGNLYIVDQSNNVIRHLDAATGVITTYAGTGARGFSGDGSPATSAQLADPAGITLDANGNLYIADYGNHRVRRVHGTSGRIETIAGTGISGFSGDGGPAQAARISSPLDVVIASDGSILFVQAGPSNHRIRRIY